MASACRGYLLDHSMILFFLLLLPALLIVLIQAPRQRLPRARRAQCLTQCRRHDMPRWSRPAATTRTSVVCRAISVVGLVALYSDAVVRVVGKLLALRGPPVVASAPPHSTALQRLGGEVGQQLPPPPSASMPPPPPPEWTAAAQRREAAAVQAATASAASLERELGTAPAEAGVEETVADEDEGGCGAHRLLYGNMDADLAPWHALGLRVTAAEMSRQVEHVLGL